MSDRKWLNFLPILLPVLVLVVMLLVIYLPYLWLEKPKFDFIYSIGSYDCLRFVYVDDNQLKYGSQGNDLREKQPNLPLSDFESFEKCDKKVKVYYHKVKENFSSQLALEDLKKYKVDPDFSSPDGFYLHKDYYSGIFYSYDSRNKVFLVKDTVRLKQNVQQADQSSGFEFLGWVISS